MENRKLTGSGPIAAALLERLPARLFQGPETFVLCVSGGRDSMLLLALFEELQQAGFLRREPVVFYYQHRLRAAAEEECEFVRRVVRRIGWAFYIKEGNVERAARRTGSSLEEAGRMLRYRALRRLAAGLGPARAVTGHHADDYVESLLLHLVRGGGPAALETLPLFHELDGVSIFRPLLVLDRAGIDRLVGERGIAFREDESNADEGFRRNRLRARVTGELRALGLDAVKLWRNFHDPAIEPPGLGPAGAPAALSLERRLFVDASERERKQLLDLCLRRLASPPADRALLREVDRQLRTTGRLAYESSTLSIWSGGGTPVWIFPARSSALRPFRTGERQGDRIEVRFNERRRLIAIGPGEELDHFRPGDRVVLAGGGRKRVKKIFQECGLPAPVRPRLPLVRDRASGLVRRLLLGFWEGADLVFPGSRSGEMGP